MEMTDSSSQSDDTSGGGGSSNGGGSGPRPSSRGRNSSGTNPNRRRKGTLNAKERNLRRLESNERERMRMHSLNDAFQVCHSIFITLHLKVLNRRYWCLVNLYKCLSYWLKIDIAFFLDAISGNTKCCDN